MGNNQTVLMDPLRPPRPPISGQSGLQALYGAERVDNYREQVENSPINHAARKGQNYLPSPQSIDLDVPVIDLAEPWPFGHVVWMDPTADNGLPHTRPPNLICMPRDFPERHLNSTILHERVHVSQRLHTQAWQKIMEEAWNFKPWPGILPADIQSRRRINPDLVYLPDYIWEDTWVPMALFKSRSSPVLSEVDIVWWNDQTRTLHREPPPGWIEFFGNIPGGEHPFEIIAYLVAANPKQNRAYQIIKPRLQKLPRSDAV
jgi:hypothetical protein